MSERNQNQANVKNQAWPLERRVAWTSEAVCLRVRGPYDAGWTRVDTGRGRTRRADHQ